MSAHCAHDQSRGTTLGAVRILCAALMVSLTGCDRKAPGPQECGALATAWVNRARAVTRYAPKDIALPSSAADIEHIARLCITTPFDQQVIACARAGGSPEYCLQRFADRRRRDTVDMR